MVWVKDDDAAGYHAEYLTTASLAYEWSDKLGTYWEVAANFNTDDRAATSSFSAPA